jgi:hypothetical protein
MVEILLEYGADPYAKMTLGVDFTNISRAAFL